jgi:hypothetical protein
MEKGQVAVSDKSERKEKKGRYAEWVAFLVLSAVAVIGRLAVNTVLPNSDSLTLILFGTGIISSVILIKIE